MDLYVSLDVYPELFYHYLISYWIKLLMDSIVSDGISDRES